MRSADDDGTDVVVVQMTDYGITTTSVLLLVALYDVMYLTLEDPLRS